MIIAAVNISLITLGIYASVQDGYVLSGPRVSVQNLMDRIFGVVWSERLQKPLFSCAVCMSSFWTLVLSPYFGIAWYDVPAVILTVAGINFLFLSANSAS